MAFKAFKAAVASAIAFALTQTAFAQVNPPSWWNVNDGMTSSFSWSFDTDTFPPVPTVDLEPYGSPEWTKTDGIAWLDSWNGHDGIWGVNPGGEGTLSLSLKNMPVPTNTKHMWCQLDFYTQFGSGLTPYLEASPGCEIKDVVVNLENLSDGWRRATVTYDILPQPGWEKVHFVFGSPAGTNVGAYMDNLYVGTHCSPTVPSPAALLPFVLGAIVAFRRRRR
jgi:MYXO-CTERM domain-containing protein